MKTEPALPPAPDTNDTVVLATHWHNVTSQNNTNILHAAARCGQVLIEQREEFAKQRTRGGSGFTRWIEECLPFQRANAYRYIQIAERWDEVVSRVIQVHGDEQPSIRQALKMIRNTGNEAGVEVEPEEEVIATDSRVIQSLDEVAGEKFATIYADPPWAYGNQATRAATDNHYQTMSVEDICAMPVAELAADNAQLHLWTTNGFLREAFDVVNAWGFSYRSVFVWCKSRDGETAKLGIGNYWRVSHEFMLLGIRGSATFKDKTLASWEAIDRGRHSAKPQPVREMVERAFVGPRLELFGRLAAPGWTVFGNQVEHSLFA